jgi:hypothetical protein
VKLGEIMGRSSFAKRKGGNQITKKMIASRMDDMAALMTAMEATLMEWEVWFRLIQMQKTGLTQEEFMHFVNDGPIFTEFPAKIMESVRNQMPQFEPLTADEPKKPSILGADGLPVMQDAPRVLGADGSSTPRIVS